MLPAVRWVTRTSAARRPGDDGGMTVVLILRCEGQGGRGRGTAEFGFGRRRGQHEMQDPNHREERKKPHADIVVTVRTRRHECLMARTGDEEKVFAPAPREFAILRR